MLPFPQTFSLAMWNFALSFDLLYVICVTYSIVETRSRIFHYLIHMNVYFSKIKI